jgi:signal transduction histidine kinase
MKKALSGETVYLDKRPSIGRPDLFVDTYFVPLRIQNEVQGIIIMARDVTEIVKTEKLLEQKNKELLRSNEDLQQFAHVASHDLKEPVRKVRTFTNRLSYELGEALSPNARTYLNKMETAAERMYTMIDGVLQYSSLTSMKQDLQPVDLNEVFRDILSDLELILGEKNAVVESGSLPTIEGSSILLYQLFYNLIFNSLKFTRKGISPRIQIHSETIEVVEGIGDDSNETGEYVRISIADNGIGFTDEDARRIFKPFSRLNSKDKFEGTGLGLALCKKIVERHGGTIEARGVEGSGATFFVKLPKNLRKNLQSIAID